MGAAEPCLELGRSSTARRFAAAATITSDAHAAIISRLPRLWGARANVDPSAASTTIASSSAAFQ